MTIGSDIAASGPFFPNGVTTAFPFEVEVASATDISVLWISADGSETVISPGAYGVTISESDPGGTVTFAVAPTIPQAGDELWIVLDPEFEQQDRYSDEGPFNQSLLEGSLDALARLSIWLKARVDRALRVPFGDTIGALPLTDARAGKFLAFDAGGDPVVSSGTGADAGLRDDLTASSGASLVGYTHGGTGASTRNLQTRGRERIHATDYPSLAEAVAAAPSGSEIFLPAGYTHTVASTITINKALTIRGANWETVRVTGPANAPIFQGAGTVTNFILEGVTWIGGAGTSQLLRVPLIPAANWFESKIIIRGNKINNFGAFAIERDNSVYFTEIRGNRFDNCVGCISEGWASDSVIDDNLFNDSMAGNPIIRMVGGSRTVITSNGFVRASGTITEADIEFNPNTSFGRGGRTFILHNKFGGEGEIAARPKIRVFNATAANRSTDVVVAFNQLHGEGAAATPTGTTYCFEFLNPIAGWDVFGNEFDDFDLIVKDSTAKFDGVLGSNKWGRNRYFWSRRRNGKLFENGGAQFTEIDENVYGYQPLTHSYEPREARNRLWNSSTIDLWNKSAGVTITTGQADPDGGTSAFLIESDGLSAGQNVFRSITTTGMGSSVVVRFRAKAEASTKIIVGMRDSVSPSGWIGMLQNIVLDDQWREYRFVLNGLTAANAHQLYFYPGDTVATRAGGFYLYQPQVSDYVSDYIPTPTNVGVADTTIGRRFHKKVSLAGGGKAVLPTYANNAAAISGGLAATDLYKTATGEVRVVV